MLWIICAWLLTCWTGRGCRPRSAPMSILHFTSSVRSSGALSKRRRLCRWSKMSRAAEEALHLRCAIATQLDPELIGLQGIDLSLDQPSFLERGDPACQGRFGCNRGEVVKAGPAIGELGRKER